MTKQEQQQEKQDEEFAAEEPTRPIPFMTLEQVAAEWRAGRVVG